MGVFTVCRLPLEENNADGCGHGMYRLKRIPLMDVSTVCWLRLMGVATECRLPLEENTADGCGHGM